MVDVDFDAVLEFCNNFQKNYIEEIRAHAEKLEKLSGEIDNSLQGTKFATKSQEAVSQMARKLKSASSEGETRVRELERWAKEQKEKGEDFER